jgi:hypothetical protein
MLNSLTKEELIKEIARLYPEHPITGPQLKRWVSHGLLPAPKAGKSRGRGQGIPQLWQSVCIQIIGLIIASYREHKPSLDEAARRIFAQGYVLRGDLLRKFLEEIPNQLGRVDN